MLVLVGDRELPRCRYTAVSERRFLGLCVPELLVNATLCGVSRRERRLAYQCVETLRCLCGTSVCFKEEFPLRERLAGAVPEAGRGRLLRAKAAELARMAAAGRRTAFLSAKMLDSDVLLTFERLCVCFRRVTADIHGIGLERLSAAGERYGVSVSVPPRDGYVDADAALLFHDTAFPVTLPERCAVVEAGDGAFVNVSGGRRAAARFVFPEKCMKTLPDGYPAEPLFSAALFAGKLRPEDIDVELL